MVGHIPYFLGEIAEFNRSINGTASAAAATSERNTFTRHPFLVISVVPFRSCSPRFLQSVSMSSIRDRRRIPPCKSTDDLTEHPREVQRSTSRSGGGSGCSIIPRTQLKWVQAAGFGGKKHTATPYCRVTYTLQDCPFATSTLIQSDPVFCVNTVFPVPRFLNLVASLCVSHCALLSCDSAE
jgi:hypothetical protein